MGKCHTVVGGGTEQCQSQGSRRGKSNRVGAGTSAFPSSECFPLCLPVLSILSSQTLPNAHTHICTRMHSHSHACTYTQTCRHTTHMHARTHTHVHIYTTSSFLLQSLFGAHGFSISGIPNLHCLVMVFVSSHSLGLTQLVSPTLQGSVRLLSTPLCQLCAQLS